MLKKHWFLLILFSSLRAAGEESPSFESVDRILNSTDAPRSIEGFLGELSQSYPGFFTGFTLMRESASLQGSSPKNPRAIVFGSDARMVITFNGESDQLGFYNIEMMHFVEQESGGGRFELREISFSPDGTKPAKISEINPPKCTRCHGVDPKPIWEQYDKWPGAYGEEDDALIDFDTGARYQPTGYLNSELVARHRQHLKEFRRFVSEKDQHPRYALLRFPQGTTSPVAPYIPTIRSGSDPLRPNLRLTKLFSELNAQKVARKISETGDQCLKTGAPLVAFLILNCDNNETLKPKFSHIVSNLKSSTRELSTPNALVPPQWSMLNPGSMRSDLIGLLTIMGLSDFDWSPARNKQQWSFFEGFKDGSDSIVDALWPILKKNGLSLPEYNAVRAQLYPNYYSYNSSLNYSGEQPSENEYIEENGYRSYPSVQEVACSGLSRDIAEISLEKIKEDCGVQSAAEEATLLVPKTVKMCMSCHDGVDGAPKLSLSDAKAVKRDPSLAQKIWRRINEESAELRMPPTRRISIEEYRELERFYQ